MSTFFITYRSCVGAAGYLNVEHLKAVAHLSEEMRDREVREEAFRMGITVVEWAVLMDKVGIL